MVQRGYASVGVPGSPAGLARYCLGCCRYDQFGATDANAQPGGFDGFDFGYGHAHPLQRRQIGRALCCGNSCATLWAVINSSAYGERSGGGTTWGERASGGDSGFGGSGFPLTASDQTDRAC